MTDTGKHAWREELRCVCCWAWCPNCRRCKCQVRSQKATECREDR